MDDSSKSKDRLTVGQAMMCGHVAADERTAGKSGGDDAASHDSEQCYRQLFDTARDGIVLVAGDTGHIFDVNQSFLTLSGLKRGDFLGRKVWEIGPFKNIDAILVTFKELQTRDHLYYDDLPLETARGDRTSVEIVGSAHSIGSRRILQYTIRDITRRKTMEEELWKSESRFRMLFQRAAMGIAVVDTGGIIIECNPALATMLGYAENELMGRPFTDYTHEEDRGADVASFEDLLAQRRDNYQMAIRCLRKDGTIVWGLLAASLFRNGSGMPLYAIRIIEDITDRKRAEETVIKSRQFYLSLIDDLPNPIRRADADAQSDYFNKAWIEFTGRPVSQEIGDAWIEGVHPEDRDRLRRIQVASFEQRAPYVTEYRLRNCSGVYRWMVEYGRPITDIDGGFSGYISSCYDVQDRKTFEETLRSLSTTDELTGLLNRRGFISLANQQLKIANRMGKEILLFYVDLDGMKKINDTHGHPAGDLALIETASVLRETFRESDIIGRLGGDEFAVLVPEHLRDSDEERVILRRMDESIKTRNAQEGRRYTLSISAGISIYNPKSPCSLDELILHADAVMYEEKRSKYRAQNRGVP